MIAEAEIVDAQWTKTHFRTRTTPQSKLASKTFRSFD